MNSTPTTTSQPTAAERFEEIAPVFASPRVAGPSVLFLVGPWLLLVLLLIPPAALLITFFVVLAAPLVAAALVVAVVASPYLLVRSVGRRLAERRQSSERSLPKQPGFAALATPTTARRAR
jgi:hypothetical protein